MEIVIWGWARTLPTNSAGHTTPYPDPDPQQDPSHVPVSIPVLTTDGPEGRVSWARGWCSQPHHPCCGGPDDAHIWVMSWIHLPTRTYPWSRHAAHPVLDAVSPCGNIGVYLCGSGAVKVKAYARNEWIFSSLDPYSSPAGEIKTVYSHGHENSNMKWMTREPNHYTVGKPRMPTSLHNFLLWIQFMARAFYILVGSGCAGVLNQHLVPPKATLGRSLNIPVTAPGMKARVGWGSRGPWPTETYPIIPSVVIP